MLKKHTILLLICFPLLFGCSRDNKAIQIKGSDTMVNLAQAWTEEFMLEHPEKAVAVTGGGSGAGIASLLSGTTDVAMASRNMEKKEIAMANERNIYPKEIHVASDGITLVVNPSNPVSKLTIPELSRIFRGEAQNWKEFGGRDQKIVALSRDRNSGTHVFFLEKVVKMGNKKNKDEFAAGVLMMPSSQAIVEEVISNPAAIGYIGLGYLNKKQKALAIAKDEKAAYIFPTVESVKKKIYPISRSLLFYTNGEPVERVKSFIDFVFSPKGQEIVLKMDFVPVK